MHQIDQHDVIPLPLPDRKMGSTPKKLHKINKILVPDPTEMDHPPQETIKHDLVNLQQKQPQRRRCGLQKLLFPHCGFGVDAASA